MAGTIREASTIASFSSGAVRALLALLFSVWHGPDKRYRPEEHYMRGPGPKWRAKHLANHTSARGI
jgi:hypothetical protein